MVDNPKNNPADDEFNFDRDWGNDDASGDAFNADAFGADAFSADDFGNMASDPDSSISDPFGSGDADPFGVGFEEDDSLHAMPTPDNLSAAMEGEANPEDDFSDLGSGFGGDASSDDAFGGVDDHFGNEQDEPHSFATQDGFDSGGDLFAQGQSGDEFAATADAFENGDQNGYAEDAYSQNAQEVEELAAPAPASKSGGLDKGKLILLAGVAVLFGVGYVGLTSVLPMFMGGGNDDVAPVVAQTPVAPQNQFPTALPGQDGGLTLPTQPVSSNPAPALPLATGGETEAPSLPALPSIPASQDGGVAIPTALPPSLELPSTPALPGDDVAAALPPVSNLPEVGSEDDLVSGDRGGITSMRSDQEPNTSGPVTDETSAAVKEVLAKLTSLENELERGLRDINSRIDGLETRTAVPTTSPSEPLPVSAAGPVSAGGQPPLKPTIIEHMTLKGVSRGMAWVKTDTGVIEARVGDQIGDAGRVLGINEYNGTWMVSTDKGLILQ